MDDVNETEMLKTVFNGEVVYEKGADQEIKHDEDLPGTRLSPVDADEI